MNYFGDFIVICSVSSLKHWMPRATSTFSTTLTQTVYYSALEEVSTLHIFCHLPASITPLQACFYLQCKLTELHDHIVQKSVYLLCVKYWIYMYHLHKEYSLIHPMNCLQNDISGNNPVRSTFQFTPFGSDMIMTYYCTGTH